MPADERDELKRLQWQLKEITAERDRLLAENRHLLRDLKSLQESVPVSLTDFSSATSNALDIARMPAATLPAVNQESPLAAKVWLFRSLFRGREDVFARLWQNRKSGRIGYSPVCNHEWNTVFCSKPRVKCGDCPNRDFAPVTNAIIQNHLEGKHTIGIYPLLPDETCYLLAVDFDKQSWMEDTAAFLETCHHVGVPAAVERSRSGNGAHVWIFFSAAVSASTARKLGCYLLTETMSHRHQLGMDSYDRLFPNQDTLPKGGFGNLIALPLQKGPAEKGNTLFLDGSFTPYQDQWAFLASLTRLDSSVVEGVVSEAVRSGQVIGVRTSSTASPWIPSHGV